MSSASRENRLSKTSVTIATCCKYTVHPLADQHLQQFWGNHRAYLEDERNFSQFETGRTMTMHFELVFALEEEITPAVIPLRNEILNWSPLPSLNPRLPVNERRVRVH